MFFIKNMLKKIFIIILLISLILQVVKGAEVIIDYINYDEGIFQIIVNKTIKEEKVKIVEVYVNRSLYKIFYLNESNEMPIKLEIKLGKLKGGTYISARAFSTINGWSNMYEIYADSSGIKKPSLTIERDIALLIGLILILISFIYFLSKKFKL